MIYGQDNDACNTKTYENTSEWLFTYAEIKFTIFITHGIRSKQLPFFNYELCGSAITNWY